MTLRHILILGFASLILTACSSKPAAELYVLRVSDGNADANCSTLRSISMDRPSAPSELDTKRIAVMLDHNHLTYYTGANWASPFPDQLQAFMSDSLAQRGFNIHDSNADTDGGSVLHLTIREADITDINSPVVHLRLVGTVANPSGHTLHFKVNEAIPAEENHMPQIVDAYDQAASNAAATISKSMKWHCSNIQSKDYP